MIEIALRDGSALENERVAADTSAPSSITALPAFSLTDLGGKAIDQKNLLGKVAVVEFWADWCPPCRSTLAWLAEAQKKHGENVQILGIAVESEEPNIRAMVDSLKLTYPKGHELPGDRDEVRRHRERADAVRLRPQRQDGSSVLRSAARPA